MRCRKDSKERPLLTKSWMAEINQPHCARLGEILKSGPSGDQEWAEATRHAEVLNESGHVLMADSRCPDKVWADAAGAASSRQRCSFGGAERQECNRRPVGIQRHLGEGLRELPRRAQTEIVLLQAGGKRSH